MKLIVKLIIVYIVRSHEYHHNYCKNRQRSMKIYLLFCFQNLHGGSHLDLSVVRFVKYLKDTIERVKMFQFQYTKNELHLKYFPRFCMDNQLLCFTIYRNFYWLLGFSNKINATRYPIVESCSIVNQSIVKSKVKFKINYISMNDYNYGKLRLSLKEVSI